MRLCLCLAAILLVVAALPPVRPLAEMDLPGGLPDGSLLSIFFKHEGNNDHPEAVKIDLYDFAAIGIEEMAKKEITDVRAHINIGRDYLNQVVSNTYISGQWQTREDAKHPNYLELMPSTGWWRVDLYKHDYEHMTVFLQGHYYGMRTFKSPLTAVRSVYVTSYYVAPESVQFELKLPRPNLPPFTAKKFDNILNEANDDVIITNIPSFPVGAYIDMTIVLHNTLHRPQVPAIKFVSAIDGNIFHAIVRQGDTQHMQLYMGNPEHMKRGKYEWFSPEYQCTSDNKPKGDLNTLRLERTSESEVKLHVFYKQSNGASDVSCPFAIRKDLVTYLNSPFALRGQAGGLLLFFDLHLPQTSK